MSKYYIHDSNKNKPIEMTDSVSFIQIVDTSKLVKSKTAKFSQWKALENSINKILPVKDSRVKHFRLVTTDELTSLSSIIAEIV